MVILRAVLITKITDNKMNMLTATIIILSFAVIACGICFYVIKKDLDKFREDSENIKKYLDQRNK